jgi:hypothetical protein
MTLNPHPHTAGRTESPRAIRTNGVGSVTTAHLNLTRTMADQVAAEVAIHDRHATNTMELRILRRARS